MAEKGWLLSCFVALTLVVASVVSSPAVVERGVDDDIDIKPDTDFNNDLLLTQSQKDYLNGKTSTRPGDHGVGQYFYRWRHGRVPYVMAHGSFDRTQQDKIKKGMEELQRFTCISFQPKTASDKNFISIQTGGGCSSFVGDIKDGAQKVTLATGCLHHGIIMHELLHALGLNHEQTAYDRDNFVRINFHNIQDAASYNFRKIDKSKWNRVGVDYNYRSVMQYSAKAFTKNGQITIMPNNPALIPVLGQREGVWYSDVAQINKLYKCEKRCGNKNKCNSRNGYMDKDCKCVCEDGTQSCDSTNTQRPKCTNAHKYGWECYRKKVNGECYSKRDWMSRNCAMTCDMCDNGGFARTTTTRTIRTWRPWRTTTRATTRNCSDRGHQHRCPFRASIGQCFNATVRYYCPRSCNVC